MTTEAQLLQGSLAQQREHVLGIVEGLSEEQLRRPVLPSGWSCLGLVNHLAVDVERFWFRAVMAGEQNAWEGFGESSGSAWEVELGTAPETVLALYRDEIDLTDRVIEATSLDTAPAAWPDDLFGDFKLPDLRSIALHVITETACHAGHLDAAREILDGRQWLVL